MKKIGIKILLLAVILFIPCIVSAKIETEPHPISGANFNQISVEDNEKNVLSIEKQNLIKMNGNDIIWQINLNLNNDFYPRSMAVDSNDNIYVIGNYQFADANVPYSKFIKTEIVKVSKTGEILWHKPILENHNETEATRIRIYNDEIYTVTKGFKDITYNRTEPTGNNNNNFYIYDINTVYTFIKMDTDGNSIKEEQLYLHPEEYYTNDGGSIWSMETEIYDEIIIDEDSIYISLAPDQLYQYESYLFKLDKDGSLVSSQKKDYVILSIEKDDSRIIGVGKTMKFVESMGYDWMTPIIAEMDTDFNVLKEINPETPGTNVRIRKEEGGFFILSHDYDANEIPMANLSYYDKELNKVETIKLNNEYFFTDVNYASDNRFLVADNVGGSDSYGYYYFEHENKEASRVIKRGSFDEIENILKTMDLTEEELSRINTIKWIIEDNKIIGLKPGKTKMIGYIGLKKITIDLEIYDDIINPETRNNIIILLFTIAVVIVISTYTKSRKNKNCE